MPFQGGENIAPVTRLSSPSPLGTTRREGGAKRQRTKQRISERFNEFPLQRVRRPAGARRPGFPVAETHVGDGRPSCSFRGGLPPPGPPGPPGAGTASYFSQLCLRLHTDPDEFCGRAGLNGGEYKQTNKYLRDCLTLAQGLEALLFFQGLTARTFSWQ